MVDDERMPLEPGERPMLKTVRFRTLGCYPLTGAVESDADTLPADHPGDAADDARPSARAASSTTTRAASMEKKKQEGYF